MGVNCRRARLRAESGMALLGAVILIVVFGLLAIVVVSLVSTDSDISLGAVRSAQALYLANAGLERAQLQFKTGTACSALTYANTVGSGSFTTSGTLYRPVPTVLPAGITNAVSTIPVGSTAGFAPHGRIRIDSELIDYTGTTAASFTGARRGAGGTTAAAHGAGAVVAQSLCLIRSIGAIAGPLTNAQRVVEAAVPNTPFVQTGTATNAINGTVTVALPAAVDPARTFLIFNTRQNSNRPVGSELRGRIASATTLEFARVTDEATPVAINIRWYVVEYLSGVNVQRGQVGQTGTSTNVVLPTAVAALNQAFVTWSKTPTNTDVNWDDNDPILGELTTTTNLQFRATAAAATHTIWWQVIEFANPADINVQRGAIAMGAAASVTAALGTPVNVNKTFVLVGYRTTGAGADVGARMLRAQLTNSTTVTIDRNLTTSTVNELVWQVVELRDSSTVQRGSEPFAAASAQRVVALGSSVDTGRAAAFASVQPAAGQSMGRSPYNGDDVPGVGSVTLALAPNQVTLDRNNTAAAADIGWFVVEFGRGPRIDWRELFP